MREKTRIFGTVEKTRIFGTRLIFLSFLIYNHGKNPAKEMQQ